MECYNVIAKHHLLEHSQKEWNLLTTYGCWESEK